MTSSLPDLTGKHRPKSVPPISNGLMADINATLMKKVFNIAKRKGKPDIHHHHKADDLGRGFEIPERVLVFHSGILWNCLITVKDQFSSDSAKTIIGALER